MAFRSIKLRKYAAADNILQRLERVEEGRG